MLKNVPNDPMILLSVINTKLRDYYTDLDSLCEDMDLAKEELMQKLAQIDYEYDPCRNQFV